MTRNRGVSLATASAAGYSWLSALTCAMASLSSALSAGMDACSASAQSVSSANCALFSGLASQCKRNRSESSRVEVLDVNMHGITTSTRCSGAMPHEKSSRGMDLTRVDSAITRCINAATASDAGSTINIKAIHAGQLARLIKCRWGSPCVARAVKASKADVPSASANKYAVKRRERTCNGDWVRGDLPSPSS